MQRVSSLVKREVGAIIQDLGLERCGFITVTDADISPDLREGRIYISVIGSADQQKRAVELLTAQHGIIQRELSHRVVLKYTPHLHFLLDQTEAHAREIEHLLDEIKTEEPDNP
jgi:ribosome-binding factor A